MTREEIDALPDTFTLTLKAPITVGNQTLTELTFREPTAGQIQEIAKFDDVKATIELGARSAGVLPSVIQALPARQFKQVGDFLESFTQGAQKTGPSA